MIDIKVKDYYENMKAEEFYYDVLFPSYIKAEKDKTKIICDFDGGYGYDMSFLQGSFGKLGGTYGYKNVLGHMIIISKDEPGLVREIEIYMINYNNNCYSYYEYCIDHAKTTQSDYLFDERMTPCPFCGHIPVLKKDKRCPDGINHSVDAYEPMCVYDNCIIGFCGLNYSLTKDEAIEAWNKRYKI